MSEDYLILDEKYMGYWGAGTPPYDHPSAEIYTVTRPAQAERFTLDVATRIAGVVNASEPRRRLHVVRVDYARTLKEQRSQAEQDWLRGYKPKLGRIEVYCNVILKGFLCFGLLILVAACVAATVVMYDAAPTFTKILGLFVVTLLAVAEFVYRRKR